MAFTQDNPFSDGLKVRREKDAQEGVPVHSADHFIQRLLPRHFKMLDMTLEGMSEVEIAAALGMRQTSVSRVVKSPIFRSELARRREQRNERLDESHALDVAQLTDRARTILSEALPAAAQKHVDLLECDDAAIAQRSATHILDRALGRAGGHEGGSGGGGTTVNIHTDQLNILQTALSEASALSSAPPPRSTSNMARGLNEAPSPHQAPTSPTEETH